MECSEVFSTRGFDVGWCKSAKHTINTMEDEPFRERSHCWPPADRESLEQHLSQLKGAGIITESQSPYASPIVVVWKEEQKDKDLVDFRTLHRPTVPDTLILIPRIEDAFTCLALARTEVTVTRGCKASVKGMPILSSAELSNLIKKTVPLVRCGLLSAVCI